MSNVTSFLSQYMYTPDWWALHVDTPEAYTKWRNTTGEYFLDIQDARDIYYLLKSGGLAIGDTPGFGGDLNAALRSIKAETLFIGNPRDEVQVPQQVDLQAKTIPNARAVWIDSPAGHQLCCNADPQGTRLVGEAIREFLRELQAQRDTTKRTP
jgi:homoserine O-acetyltransferase/O-succinyltransferase